MKRPATATVGAVLSIIGTLFFTTILLIGMSLPSEEPTTDENGAVLLMTFVYASFNSFLGLAGAFYIFRRRYTLGGVMALVCGIAITITTLEVLEFLPVAILPAIGGILALISKEKIAPGVLGVAKLYGRIKISDLAIKIGKTEADVELAVIKLKSSGEPIHFDRETREVVHISSEEE